MLPGVDTSPIVPRRRLLGVELGIDAVLNVREDFEHAAPADTGRIALEGQYLDRGELGYLTTLTMMAGTDPVQVILLAGVPVDDEIVASLCGGTSSVWTMSYIAPVRK
ncbi:hypothetical protein E5345_06285 [Propionibacterium sp. NM47_B9-13]|uniref:Uncharacterized protein n=1 Tax=Cutibacterium modestum HL044PA1 TaxID=765109 RepID=A0ABP2K4F2_9ACTN|nr:hypothetical protein BCB70_00655 [Cutibacterium modestum]EFS75107.1 hypothetical protein HMPREF9621_00740 [Cutibacterium modestum HL037PA2]EFS91765.1 hypothetical protein HMPREF9607_01924 [Cutibacterium modestum HL044PA1]EFT15875.1 hypothetical protein HMPREF9622_01126 [Cutibacterium modestum HL037PA3]MCP2375187.1 pirin [Cutibacterium modestum 28N]MCP2378568.1 pirin [Cutibacterium modestum 31N]MCP2380907.1 pirin [Cutibacterium modestum 30N]TGY29582.1 hypothetical protein E5345_06285 [Prop